MTGEGSVNYTVKELLSMLERSLTDQMAKIAVKVDEVHQKLDLKASEVRVNALEDRLKDVEKTIFDLRLAEAGPRAISKLQGGIAVVLGGGILGILAALIYVVVKAGGHG